MALSKECLESLSKLCQCTQERQTFSVTLSILHHIKAQRMFPSKKMDTSNWAQSKIQ